ncbi:hypothetical protein QTP88_030003 [Uroleucon formosanum]
MEVVLPAAKRAKVGSPGSEQAPQDCGWISALDKGVRSILASLNTVSSMVSEVADWFPEATKEKTALLNVCFEICSIRKEAGVVREALSDATRLSGSAPPKTMCDAATDTVLTPSWWDSDRTIEAERASGERLARNPTHPTRQHAPAETEDETAMDTEAAGTWANVVRRNRRKKKTTAPEPCLPPPRAPTGPASVVKKPPAILIKPSDGRSFDDTVRSVRACGLTAQELGASVSMRKTRDGSLLLELPKGAKSASTAKSIAEALGSKLGDSVGKVSQLGVQVQEEVLDLDAVSTAADVLEALRAAIPGENDPAAAAEREAICDVRIWPVRSGQQVATAKMSRYAAAKISRIPVGWTLCRVRPRTLPPERCFRCQAFGHNARKSQRTAAWRASWQASRGLTTSRDRVRAPQGSRLPGRTIPPQMPKFLQINLNVNRAAEQLMAQTADESEADVLIVSEPATHYGQEDKWCFSSDRKAAVGISRLSTLSCDLRGSGNGFAWMAFQNLTVFSCYLRPGATMREFNAALDDLGNAIRARGDASVILAGDFNAWHTEWGSRCSNPRGCALSDLASSLGLLLANSGAAPTFRRGAATSIIDVTFFKGVTLRDWKVSDAETLSDHNYVTFSTASPDREQTRLEPHANPHPGWTVKKLDADALSLYLTTTRLSLIPGPASAEKALTAADNIEDLLLGACDACMPKRSPGPVGRRPVYWWSDEIAELRRVSLDLRRRYQACFRRAGHPGVHEARTSYSAAKRALRIAIRAAKCKAWADLCLQVDKDPWGRPYRLVMKKFGNRDPAADSRGREAQIADSLFPAAPVTNWSAAPSSVVCDLFSLLDPETGVPDFQRSVPEFTSDELRAAARRLPRGKAPGPSGIPNEILRALVTTQGQAVLKTMNDCLSALTFPPRWKRARLVLIRKGADKPREAPSSYRPICMLDSTGKLLERLLLQRLERHLDEHGGTRRAANQFGFRKGIGTDSAVNSVLSTAAQAASTPGKKSLCVLVTLDVKNAFNSLRWPVIDAALRRLRTPEYLVEMLRSWLSDRTLLTGADRTPRPVTCGVPQGSVLGPALWNVAYSSLLKMKTPPGVQLIGFADDLAVVGTAVTGQLLEDLVNPVLRNIDEWMTSHGLELAHHKTEAVILSRRRAYVPPRLSIAGHPITLYDRIRYLGVVLDRNLTFAAHVDTVAKKASRTAAALARLMPNIGGPSEWKRKLLGSVVDSQLLYAAPAWIDKVAAVARTRVNLIRPQRTVALRTIRAYRTVSDEAALVLASTVPADLLGLERKRVQSRLSTAIVPGPARPSKASIKRDERARTIEAWQQRWEATSKAAWTRRCIPSVGRWLGRTVPEVPVTYHMSQALSGHGCFQAYLFKRARASSPACPHCPGQNDTAEHTLFECPYWSVLRVPLATHLGRSPVAADIEDIVCGPPFDQLPTDSEEKQEVLKNAEEAFRLFYGMVEGILSVKEEEERARQAAEPAG